MMGKKCLNIIEIYRKGGQKLMDKVLLIAELLSALATTTPELSDSKLDDSLGSYLDMLEQHDRSVAAAFERTDRRVNETEEDTIHGVKQAVSLGTPNETGKKTDG